jgi:hypothetical protein
MQGSIAFAQLGHAVHISTNQVFHADITMAGTIAQRPAGYCSDMLLKLTDVTAVLCPMT